MSGRVRVTLSDGRRVTGFRKTLARRAPRTPAHLMPDWTAGFVLPDGITLNPNYQHGVTCVAIGPAGHVTITGKNRDFVLGQVHKLVRKIAPSWRRELQVHLTRPAESGPTFSGPPRPAIDRVVALRFDDRAPIEVNGLAMRQLEMAM